jgi:broad specificity phosphatase PhoE
VKIVLARHGKPDLQRSPMLAPKEMQQWIEAYEASGILAQPLLPSVTAIAVSAGHVLTSTCRRAIESARALGLVQPAAAEAVFREAGLFHFPWRFPPLPPALWVVIFRLAWFLGFCGSAESLHQAKARARLAARHLVELAEEKGSVLLIGHGIMNQLIAKELLALGWRGPKRPSSGYWKSSTYIREET